MDRLYDIVSLGECLVDILCEEKNGALVMQGNAGGAPANLLAMASRLGCRTSLLTKVGQDRFGQFLFDALRNAGIGVQSLKADGEHPTTLAIVQLDAHGERSFSFYRNCTADVMLSNAELDPSTLQNTRIFHFGSLSLTDEPVRSATWAAIKTAKAAGARISFDPNWRPPLWRSREKAVSLMQQALTYADYVKVSEEELSLITGENDVSAGIRVIFAAGPAVLLAVTKGEHGALLANRHCCVEVPAYRMQALDTTGAGDAFYGALLAAILESGQAPEAFSEDALAALLRFASAAGALSTTKQGGISAQPSREEILTLMK